MKQWINPAAVAACVGLVASAASAVPVDNFSFERPEQLENAVPPTTDFEYQPDDNLSTANGQRGWDFNPGSGITKQQTGFAGDANGGTIASEGTRLGFLQGTTEIAQSIRGLNSNTTTSYTLTFDAAGRADNGSNFGLLSVLVGDANGGTAFVAFPSTPIPVGTESDPNNLNAPKVLTTYSTEFVNIHGFGLRLRFIHEAQTPGTDVSTVVDNVRLDLAPVPEPTSLALLGAGAIGLIGRRRR